MNILDILVNINESATTYKELSDVGNGRFFKEYKHTEPAELASRKLEAKLRSINPSSTVIRDDPYHFVMVHPGGDLVTVAESTDQKHIVATHHISPFARDYGKSTELSKEKHLLYETVEDQFENSDLFEDVVGAVNSDYIVHDQKGNVFFRHKNPTVLKHAIANMQKHYFHDNPKAHHVDPENLKITPRDEYIRKFGSGELHHPIPTPPMNESYHGSYDVDYSYIKRSDRRRLKRKFKINYAVSQEHALQIAHRIARKRRLLGFRIHVNKKDNE